MRPTRRPLTQYQGRPLDYLRRVLKAEVWSVQAEICRLLYTPPYRVLARACHKVGKSWLAAGLINYHFDCYDPSLTITTAPTAEAVKDQLWREVRIMRTRAGRGGFTGPVAPVLWSSVDHWAKGFTTAKGESFQGRHQKHVFYIVDEGVGVQAWVYGVINSMFKPDGFHHLLVIGNPTDTASQMYAEEFAEELDGSPKYHVVQMSALDHPNLQAEMRGEPAPFPAAVSLGQFESWVADWCDPIPAEEATATDFQWPPEWWRAENAPDEPPTWFRPGPEMESRGLGRWPSAGTYGVWSDGAWQAACRDKRVPPRWDVLPMIGCDVARYGDDFTAIHVRHGPTSLHHERHNGWSEVRTAARLIELANEWAAWLNGLRPSNVDPVSPKHIPINVDDAPVGGGVNDIGHAQRCHFRPVLAQQQAVRPDLYDKARSELWFNTAKLAMRGQLDLSRIRREDLLRLRKQAMAPIWAPNAAGCRCVEEKAKTKDRLKMGSPDDMDALNLAYYDGTASTPTVISTPSPGVRPQPEGGAQRRGWFGMEKKR